MTQVQRKTRFNCTKRKVREQKRKKTKLFFAKRGICTSINDILINGPMTLVISTALHIAIVGT